jgi:hypothetical protein
VWQLGTVTLWPPNALSCARIRWSPWESRGSPWLMMITFRLDVLNEMFRAVGLSSVGAASLGWMRRPYPSAHFEGERGVAGPLL